MRIYFTGRMLAILMLGFASGLPLALTASTLSVWLTESHVDKTTIGLFAAIATPYALKFLWAPLIDGIRLPLLYQVFGQRRSWLLLIQLLLMLSIVLLGFANPAINPWFTALAAFTVALFSASQDIVIDAYRVELLPEAEQGAGAAMSVLGYRLGMMMSSAGALFLVGSVGWGMTYNIMAALILAGLAAHIIAGEPKHTNPSSNEHSLLEWLQNHVVAPFKEFTTRQSWFLILLFIVLYKFADAFIGIMTNPFLLEIGFTREEIASVVKLYGLIATIIGSFIGGYMVLKLGTLKTLWLGGILHGLTNLMFYVQAKAGADIHILALGISLENVSGGIGTAAFVAYLSHLCNARFTATQYALLSSLAAVGRTWLSTPAGKVSEALGWEGFFIFSTLLAIPGLILLWWLERKRA